MRGAGLEVTIVRHLFSRECSIASSKSLDASSVGAVITAAQREKQQREHEAPAPAICTSTAHARDRKILGRKCLQTASQESVRNFVSTSAQWGVGEGCVCLRPPDYPNGSEVQLHENSRHGVEAVIEL